MLPECSVRLKKMNLYLVILITLFSTALFLVLIMVVIGSFKLPSGTVVVSVPHFTVCYFYFCISRVENHCLKIIFKS